MCVANKFFLLKGVAALKRLRTTALDQCYSPETKPMFGWPFYFNVLRSLSGWQNSKILTFQFYHNLYDGNYIKKYVFSLERKFQTKREWRPNIKFCLFALSIPTFCEKNFRNKNIFKFLGFLNFKCFSSLFAFLREKAINGGKKCQKSDWQFSFFQIFLVFFILSTFFFHRRKPEVLTGCQNKLLARIS